MRTSPLLIFQTIACNAWTFSPSWPWSPNQWSVDTPKGCLTHAQANLTATRLRSTLALENSDLGTPLESLEKYLAEDFSSSSDSYNMIWGALDQVGKLGTWNRTSEIAGFKAGPMPQSGIETTVLAVTGCHSFFWFWNMTRFGNESLKYPIRGMHYMTVNEDLQIVDLYTETNGLAYAADLGFKIEYPNGTILPSMKAP